MERECLNILLRGTQPIIIATPSPRSRILGNWKDAIRQQRLAIITPAETARRTTTVLAERRNHLVAHLATALFVPYASPGGKTEALALLTIASGKPVVALVDPANGTLVAARATAVAAPDLAGVVARRFANFSPKDP